jgi:hypothetical protein
MAHKCERDDLREDVGVGRPDPALLDLGERRRLPRLGHAARDRLPHLVQLHDLDFAAQSPAGRRGSGAQGSRCGSALDVFGDDAAVVQEKAFDYLDAPIARVGAKFTPIPFAPVMEEWVVPHAEDVLAAIKKTVGKE